MENSRFWLFLGLGVAAMLSMKYVASPGSGFGHWKNGWHTAYDADDGSIDSRRLHAHGGGVPRPHPVVAGLNSSLRHTTSASLAPAVPAKTVKKADPKKDDKKEKDDKKKKKTKKADVNGGTMTAPAETLPDSTGPAKSHDNSSSNSNSGVAPQAGASYAQANPGAPAAASPTKTLQQWEALLIANPSYAQTVAFVKAYQAKQVTSTIFYAIVKEMLASKTTVLNQYGVMALQATPSVTSLNMLVALTSTDSTVTAQINSALAAYETLSYLPVLKTALTSSTSATTLSNLLSLVTASAQKNLTATTGTTGSGETAQGGVATTTKTAYASLVTTLETLEAKATDAASQQALFNAITTITNLGVTTTPTAVAEANREYYQTNWR